MAEFNAFAVGYGRHGAVDAASNIDPTDLRATRYPLGHVVEGEDSAGYWGRWIWLILAESVTVTSTTKPVMTFSLSAFSASVQWSVVKLYSAFMVNGFAKAAGVIEGTSIATYYSWVRYSGYVTGVLLADSGGGSLVGSPLTNAGSPDSGKLAAWSAGVGGPQVGRITAASTGSSTSCNVVLDIPTAGRM